MHHVSIITLMSGIGLVALHGGLLPVPVPEGYAGRAVQAAGGALVILGLATVGFGLPLFR